jgi:isopenicillin N synthase-like dioxygenase
VSNLNHYPAVPIDTGEFAREPPHSDLSTLSLHFQGDVGGLQVADMSSTTKTSSVAVSEMANFIDIEPDPDLVLVNAGYLLMRLTNGKIKNSVYKLIESPVVDGSQDPRLEAARSERYSIAFFSFPDADTFIKPLDSRYISSAANGWEPFNAGEYLCGKRVRLYSDDT